MKKRKTNERMKDEGMQTFQWSLEKNSPLIMDLEEGSACSASPMSHYSYYFIPAFYFLIFNYLSATVYCICIFLMHQQTHTLPITHTHVRDAHINTKKECSG